MLIGEAALSIVCFSLNLSLMEVLLHPTCCDQTTGFRRPADVAIRNKAHHSCFVRYSRCHLSRILKLVEQFLTRVCSSTDLASHYDSASSILAWVLARCGASALGPRRSSHLVCLLDYGSPSLTSWGFGFATRGNEL